MGKLTWKTLTGGQSLETINPQPEPKYIPTNDPIENYMNILKLQDNIELTDVPNHNRTLVIVYGDSSSTGDFQERAARLVSGFNTHETIKAVVVTITGDKVYQGLTFENAPSDKEFDPVRFKEIAHKFTQVVEVRDARNH